MSTFTSYIDLKTKGEPEIINITQYVDEQVKSSGVRTGLVCVFINGSTGAVTTIEFEPGLLNDLPKAMERFAPHNAAYEHHLRWQDGNGHSHVRAAIIGPSLTIPIIEGQMPLGTWQQIVFLELDVRPRNRQLIVQVVGE
ncbi:MAG: secondary thiamine-phosphate synthase enzyme YjbQ [Promethearchaeota archaeon]